MKTITARYSGRCARTGAPINPGDLINWSKGKAELAPLSVDHDLELARSIDPELAATDPEGASAGGRYLARSMRRGVSDTWSAGGREYYRNRRGRCEDAPCCGCCNA
jgi:hypothetical protein